MNETIADTLKRFHKAFGFELHHDSRQTPECALKVTSGLSRQDVTVHWLIPESLRPEEPRPDLFAMKRWLLAEGVHLVALSPQNEKNYVQCLVVPIVPVSLPIAFHATARRNLPGIEKEGLLPGDFNQGRASNGDRDDCRGCIFACEKLGVPTDVGQPHTFSGHWWRGELSVKSEDKDWVILRLEDLDTIPGLKVTRDYMSESGLILLGVERIPGCCIRLEWPLGEVNE